MSDVPTSRPFYRRRPVLSGLLALVVMMPVVYAGLYAAAPLLWPHPPPDHSDVTNPRFHEGLAAYGKADYRTAMDIWLPLARAGLPAAQYRVGRLFSFGEGVTHSDEEAFRWYLLAAEQGQMNAQYNLGASYWAGKGVVQNQNHSDYWFHAAAEQGHVMAMVSYAHNLREQGRIDEASVWFWKASNRGNKFALVFLSTFGDKEARAMEDWSDYPCLYFVNGLMNRSHYPCGQ